MCNFKELKQIFQRYQKRFFLFWSFVSIFVTFHCPTIDPVCSYSNTEISHNVSSLDVYDHGTFSYNFSSISLLKHQCNIDDFLLAYSGSTKGISKPYLFARFTWDKLNCTNGVCQGFLYGLDCTAAIADCSVSTRISEPATIDANGDINTFTEIVSSTFRIVPVR